MALSRRPLALAVALFGCAPAPPATPPSPPSGTAAPEPEVEPLAWLAGTWTAPGRAAPVTEVWTTPVDGVWLGVNHSGGHVELLRIEADGNGPMRYTAAPPGQAITTFTAEHAEPRGHAWVFRNAAHDYPTAIRYEPVAADGFVATVSGDPGAPRASWRFERTGEPAALREVHGTVSVDAATKALAIRVDDLPCAELVCAVLPAVSDPVLHVAALERGRDCTTPATAQCQPGAAGRIRVGDVALQAELFTGPIPVVIVELTD